jgi:tRNA dimethylallyltransferase
MSNTVIVISGATGTGKTTVGAALSGMIGGEIISADSRQVYRYLDIGTNKSGTWEPDNGIRRYLGIPQYVTDLIDPSESFSAGTFVERAIRHCIDIIARGKIPVIVGGTGLYIKAMVDGMADLPTADPLLRRELAAEIRVKGPLYLYEQLNAVDPVSAQKNQHNPQRLIRALEVFRLTGIPLSRLHETTKKPTNYQFLQFSLDWPREELNALLDKRTAAMFDAGLLEETRAVLGRGFKYSDPALEGIGYRHAIQHINGALSLADAIEQTRSDTRHYAKRQVTWFRNDPRILHIPCTQATFDQIVIAQNITDSLKG